MSHFDSVLYSVKPNFSRIDFSSVGSDDLTALYRACKAAEFGRNGENIFDESYRKARKMDLTSFATAFDSRSLDIHEQISKALLTQSHAMMELELYKLNVYSRHCVFQHRDWTKPFLRPG